jgi:heparanase
MNHLKIIGFIALPLSISFASCHSGGNSAKNNSDSTAIKINLSEMKQIGTVNERFQSYNVEMVEVVGGEFWKPYKMMDSLPSLTTTSNYDVSQKNDQLYRKLSPINLADKRLLTLAKGLAPAYVRVSGTWANAIYFQDNDEPQIVKAPAGFVNVLTRKQWNGVVDFLKATNSKLVTSFAVSNGVRDAQGVWTPKEAQKIVNYTKSIGGEIAAAELFNEPSMPTAGGEVDKNYNGQSFAKDIQAYTAWAKKEVPNMLLLGPGSVGEGIPGVTFAMGGMKILSTDEMMSAEPKPQFDIFSYHFYGAASMRMMRSGPFSIKAENALSPEWLNKTNIVADYYMGLRDKYNPKKPVWITETAEAAGGGDPFSATYLDCFRYLYQMGSLAKKGVQVIMHNTLAASEYSLIDQDTHLPKPNYWCALLWKKLMGTAVLDAGSNSQPGVYLFAHNTPGTTGGVTLLVINTNKTTPVTIHIPNDATQYTLTADTLEGEQVKLNGGLLKLTANDELPEIKGKSVKPANVLLPATSISFFTFADAGNTGANDD